MAFLRLLTAAQERRLQGAEEDASAGDDQEGSDVATFGRGLWKRINYVITLSTGKLICSQ